MQTYRPLSTVFPSVDFDLFYFLSLFMLCFGVALPNYYRIFLRFFLRSKIYSTGLMLFIMLLPLALISLYWLMVISGKSCDFFFCLLIRLMISIESAYLVCLAWLVCKFYSIVLYCLYCSIGWSYRLLFRLDLAFNFFSIYFSDEFRDSQYPLLMFCFFLLPGLSMRFYISDGLGGMMPHGLTQSICILSSPGSKAKNDFSKNRLEVIIVQNCINVSNNNNSHFLCIQPQQQANPPHWEFII